MNICFTIDESYVQHVCVVIRSIAINNSFTPITVYIVSFGIRSETVARLKKFILKLKHLQVVFIKAERSLVDGFKVTGHASGVNYLRLFLPNLLPAVDKTIYLDADLVVIGDLRELYNINIEDRPLAAVPAPTPEVSDMLGIDADLYFNSGVMLLNLHYWRLHGLPNRLKEFILNNPEKITFWDQDALNANTSDTYLKLDQKWNFMQYNSELRGASIVHFAGKHKPWHYYCEHPLRYLYFHYLKQTPWENFTFPETSVSARIRQLIRRLVNAIG